MLNNRLAPLFWVGVSLGNPGSATVLGRHKATEDVQFPGNHSLFLFKVPHATTEDLEYKGYYFKKGTMFISNIYAVHMDPVTWPEPEVFNPSRHLTEDGKFFKRDEYIPFCIGEWFCTFYYITEDKKRQIRLAGDPSWNLSM